MCVYVLERVCPSVCVNVHVVCGVRICLHVHVRGITSTMHTNQLVTLSGELIVSKYVAESITMIAGRFGHEGLCQLHTELRS